MTLALIGLRHEVDLPARESRRETRVLTGSIDVAAERARLTKDLASVEKDRATATAKLGNEGFMAKAPENVVAEIRERLLKCDQDIERIKAQLASLPS